MLLENDMIEPSKSPWACGKVMAKKKEGDGNLYFLVTGGHGEAASGSENLVLSLTRLRDFLMEREVKELSLPVYDPIRGRLHPRELYALIHAIFSDTNIQVSEILQA